MNTHRMRILFTIDFSVIQSTMCLLLLYFIAFLVKRINALCSYGNYKCIITMKLFT